MRISGHNVLAIIVATLAIYLIEYVIFAVLIPGEQYADMIGMTYVQGGGDMSRMPYGIVMPLLSAIGLSCAIKWRGDMGPVAGLMTGVLLAVLFGFSVTMYSWVYGEAKPIWLAISLGHFIVAWGVAGAVLGAWK